VSDAKFAVFTEFICGSLRKEAKHTTSMEFNTAGQPAGAIPGGHRAPHD